MSRQTISKSEFKNDLTSSNKPIIYTIGHSTRDYDDFIGILKKYKIELLIDVRSYPGSKRYPHFNKEEMMITCPNNGIKYMHLAQLGGLKKKTNLNSQHTSLTHPSFKNYADYMDGDIFNDAILKLEELARKQKVAYFCSEAVWWKCHRRMISDMFIIKGWIVQHLGLSSKENFHSAWDICREDYGKLIYDLTIL